MDAKHDITGLAPLLQIDGRCARITLRRPKLRNRLESADVSAVRAMLRQIDADPSIGVLVLTGEGRVFSAGYDLDDLGRRSGALADDGHVAVPAPDFAAMTTELENLRMPTICRLNGSVYGGSTDLALSCDFRIGVHGSEMFMPASRLGLHYYPEGLGRWVQRLGLDAAKMLFLTSSTIGDEEMLRIGYLTARVPPEELDAAVDNLVRLLLAQAPRAVEGMKRALNEAAQGQFDHSAAQARHVASLGSRDLREGMAAWHEKRQPSFSGH
jgi:enoyl-CoA hydratase